MRSLKSKILSFIVIILICSISIIPVFADDSNEIMPRATNAPARYEYTSRIVRLNKAGVDVLHKYAYRANSQNSTSSLVSLASYMLGLANFSASANILGGISYLIQSDLNVVETMNFAYQKYKYLSNNPKVKYVKAKISFKRFFNGYSMSPWYPYSYPKNA